MAGEPFDRVVYPFALPDVNTTWVILVDVPHSAINAPVQDQTFMMIVAGIVWFWRPSCSALYFAVRSLVQKPLGGLVASVKALSDGRYEQPVAGQDRADEIGSGRQGLEGFRLRSPIPSVSKPKPTNQRDAAENERGRSETERQQSMSACSVTSCPSSAPALSELSQGNLGHRITDEFPGEYDKLKQDFNAAPRKP